MLELLADASRVLASPLTRLLDASDPFGFVCLGGGALIAALAVLARGAGAPKAARALFPPGIFAHPSARLDVKVFAVTSLLRAGALAYFVLAPDAWRRAVGAGLDAVLGPAAPAASSVWGTAGATAAAFLAFEFGYWLAHRLAHESEFLWRFHSRHHSAEVLTPLTGQREHPVDSILFANVIALCVGVAGAVVGRFTFAGETTLFGVNLLLFGVYASVQHLRHSHVWAPIRGVLGHIVQSPAHHQLHHSIDPDAQRRNLGFSLAIFDTLFGTLRLPGAEPPARFGVGTGSPETLDTFFFDPFTKADDMVTAGRLPETGR